MGLSYQEVKNIKKNSIVLEKEENIEIKETSSGFSQIKKSFIRERLLCRPQNKFGSNYSKQEFSKANNQKNSSSQDLPKKSTNLTEVLKETGTRQTSKLNENSQHGFVKLQEQERDLLGLRKDKEIFGNKNPQHSNKSTAPGETWAEHLAGNCDKEIAKERFSLQHQCVTTPPRYGDDKELLPRPRQRTVASQMSAREHSCQQGAEGDHKSYVPIKSKRKDKDQILKDTIKKYIKSDLPNVTTSEHIVQCCCGIMQHCVCPLAQAVKGVICRQHNYLQSPVCVNRQYSHCQDEHYFDGANCQQCKSSAAKHHYRCVDTPMKRKSSHMKNKNSASAGLKEFIESKKGECERQRKNNKKQMKKLELNKTKKGIERSPLKAETFRKFLSESEAAELLNCLDSYIDEREKELGLKPPPIPAGCVSKTNANLNRKPPPAEHRDNESLASQYSVKTLEMPKRMKIREYKPQKPNIQMQEIKQKLDQKDNKKADKNKNYQQYVRKFAKEEEEEMEKSIIKEPTERISRVENINSNTTETTRKAEIFHKETTTATTFPDLNLNASRAETNFHIQTEKSQVRNFPYNKDVITTSKGSNRLRELKCKDRDDGSEQHQRTKLKDLNTETKAEVKSQNDQNKDTKAESKSQSDENKEPKMSGHINAVQWQDFTAPAYRRVTYNSDKITDSTDLRQTVRRDYDFVDCVDEFYEPEMFENHLRKTKEGIQYSAERQKESRFNQHSQELRKEQNAISRILRERIVREVHEHETAKTHNNSESPKQNKKLPSDSDSLQQIELKAYSHTQKSRERRFNEACDVQDQMLQKQFKQLQYEIARNIQGMKSNEAHEPQPQYSTERQRGKRFSASVEAKQSVQSRQQFWSRYDHGVGSEIEKEQHTFSDSLREGTGAYKHWQYSLTSSKEQEFNPHQNGNDLRNFKTDHQMSEDYNLLKYLIINRLTQGTLIERQEGNRTTRQEGNFVEKEDKCKLINCSETEGYTRNLSEINKLLKAKDQNSQESLWHQQGETMRAEQEAEAYSRHTDMAVVSPKQENEAKYKYETETLNSELLESDNAELLRALNEEVLSPGPAYSRRNATTVDSLKQTGLKEEQHLYGHKSRRREFENEKTENALQFEYLASEKNTEEFGQNSTEAELRADKNYYEKCLAELKTEKEAGMLADPQLLQGHATQKSYAGASSRPTHFHNAESATVYKSAARTGQAELDALLEVGNRNFYQIFQQKNLQPQPLQELNTGSQTSVEGLEMEQEDKPEMLQEGPGAATFKQAQGSCPKEKIRAKHDETLHKSYSSNCTDVKKLIDHRCSQIENGLENLLTEQVSKETYTKEVENEEVFLPLIPKAGDVLKTLKTWLEIAAQTDMQEDKCFSSVTEAAENLINRLSSCKSLDVSQTLIEDGNLTEQNKCLQAQTTDTLKTQTAQEEQFKDLETSPDSSDAQMKSATIHEEDISSLEQRKETELPVITRRHDLALNEKLPTLSLTKELAGLSEELPANTYFEQATYKFEKLQDAKRCQAQETHQTYQESKANLTCATQSRGSVKTDINNQKENPKTQSYILLVHTAGPKSDFDPDLMSSKGVLKSCHLPENSETDSDDLTTRKTNSAVSNSEQDFISLQQRSSMINNVEGEKQAAEINNEDRETFETKDTQQANAIVHRQPICADCQLETETELGNCCSHDYDSTAYTVQMPGFNQCPCMWDTYLEMMINYYRAKKF